MARPQRLAWLLLACLRLDATSAISCDGDCVVKAERVTPSGRVPFDHSKPLVTAVGCFETLEITFGSHQHFSDIGVPASEVLMLKSDRSSTYTAGTDLELTSDEGVKNRVCCKENPKDRDKALLDMGMIEKCRSDPALFDTPMNLFEDCMTKYPGVTDAAAGTTTIKITFIVPERADMTIDGEEDPMGTSDGMHSFLLQAEFKTVIQGQEQSVIAQEYPVSIQVQRCSACLEKGEGLNSLAKRFGTHWTQIYSANHNIVGSPDELEEARLVRLGSLYSVRSGDTLMSIALKFGVTVNQLFMWNGNMRSALDTMPESPNHMSRALTIGQVFCVLPKTCHNSFEGSQPVFSHLEVQHFPGAQHLEWNWLVDPPTPP
eukprot:Tamp_14351.p1 GENE.Tamp_14351~~Tamp_14351.p1  ORF type:complete len:388 (-),score=80.65 Tamp_14351:470-1591(-)